MSKIEKKSEKFTTSEIINKYFDFIVHLYFTVDLLAQLETPTTLLRTT